MPSEDAMHRAVSLICKHRKVFFILGDKIKTENAKLQSETETEVMNWSKRKL